MKNLLHKLAQHFTLRSQDSAVNWLWLSFAVILLDQFTKFLITSYFGLFDVVAVLPFFNLVLLHNTGAAFSFLADASGWQRWFFIFLGLGVSTVVLLWLRRLPHTGQRWLAAALTLVVGGALGNVIDRAVHGYVIDFLDFYYKTWHWPAFNVADMAIVCGAIMLVLDSLFFAPRREKQQTESPPSPGE